MHGDKKISVLVPAHNEEKNIFNCLNSLCAQNLAPFEIIVINDNSSDSTQKIVKNFQAHHKIVKLVNRKECKGYTYAIMTGLEHAKGNVIAILDADSTAPDNWTKNIIKAFADKNVGCVGGLYIPSNTSKWMPFLEKLYILYSHDKNKIRGLAGTNLAFDRRKSNQINIFKTVPKFSIDKHIQEKFRQEGIKIKYLRQNFVFSKAPETMRAYVKQWFKWGKGMAARPRNQIKKAVFNLAVLASLPILILLLFIDWRSIILYLFMAIALISYIYGGFKEKPSVFFVCLMILQKFIGICALSIGYFKFKICKA